MNLILLFPEDFTDPHTVRLHGRRRKHVEEIHRAKAGDRLCVGLCNGLIGEGKILKIDEKSLEMRVTVSRPPPAALPATIILALPRPNVLKRTLLTAASMGIKRLVLLNFNRVDKSFWNSSSLKEEAIREALVLGLEQAKDTVLPEIFLRKRFKPFVEDELPAMVKGAKLLVAHPGATVPCPVDVKGEVVLLIGPEGGLVPFEIEKLTGMGFTPVHLGERILRVEAALPAVLARLFP